MGRRGGGRLSRNQSHQRKPLPCAKSAGKLNGFPGGVIRVAWLAPQRIRRIHGRDRNVDGACRSGLAPFVLWVKGKVVMQWVAFHQAPSRSDNEEERIDVLARRFACTGLMFCVTAAAAAWFANVLA